VDNVYRYRGLPNDIISYQGPQFISKFWRSLLKIPKVDIKLSSAFHPQTNGQTEYVNQVLEQYLRCTINYQQDDWTSYLPLAEFAYNNTIHASTQQTPFYANYGHHPKLDLLDPSKANNPAAADFATRLLQFQDAIQFQLQEAQDRYKASVDESRKEHPLLQVDDKVWLL
jgi:transposase InsO family protein